MRSDYLLIAVFLLDFAQILLEAVAQGGAFRQPERKACAYRGRERKKFHFLAKNAVVALLRLLEESEILVELLFLGEGYSVDAHELLTLLVATPVCAGKTHHLYGLDRSRGRKVRSAAEIGERSLRIGRDVSVLKLAYKLALVDFAAVAEHTERVGLGNVLADDILLAAGKLEHLLLYFREILGGDLMLAGIYVVIESVFDGRTDSELHTGVKFLKGLCEKVRRRVPERMFPFGVIPFEKFYRGIGRDRTGDVPFLSVDLCRENIGRKPRTDAFGNAVRSDPGFELSDAAVGKFYIDHKHLIS